VCACVRAYIVVCSGSNRLKYNHNQHHSCHCLATIVVDYTVVDAVWVTRLYLCQRLPQRVTITSLCCVYNSTHGSSIYQSSRQQSNKALRPPRERPRSVTRRRV